MVTLTFNALGLIFAGVSIFMGLAIPMAKNEGDNGVGFAYAACIIVVSVAAYLLGVGLTTVFGS